MQYSTVFVLYVFVQSYKENVEYELGYHKKQVVHIANLVRALVKRGKKAAECENPSPLQPLGVPRELPWQKRKEPAAEEKQESAEETAKRARLLESVKPMFDNQCKSAHLTTRESFYFGNSAADSPTACALIAK